MTNRKDSRNRVLKQGEGVRKKGNVESYYYRWTDENGKRNTIYCNDLKKLREREKKIIESLAKKIKFASNITVNDMYSTWLSIKRGIKNNTLENYKYMYETYVYSSFGNSKLENLSKADVRKFYIKLVEDKNLKVRTVNCIHTVLSQVIEVAVEEGYLSNNITTNAMQGLYKEEELTFLPIDNPTDKRMALTRKEHQLFESCIMEDCNLYLRPIFLTMLETGLRVGEATGLRWCDIDFEKNEIRVTHTLVYYKRAKKCSFAINPPKTKNSTRRVGMTAKLKKALKELRELQDENQWHSKQTIDGYFDFVFFNKFGNVYHQAVLNKALRRIQKECNLKLIKLSEDNEEKEVVLLPEFTCHVLRHTAATRMCESGINTRYIMDVLGHSDIRTTMNIYVDVTEELKVSEISRFEEYMNQIHC